MILQLAHSKKNHLTTSTQKNLATKYLKKLIKTEIQPHILRHLHLTMHTQICKQDFLLRISPIYFYLWNELFKHSSIIPIIYYEIIQVQAHNKNLATNTLEKLSNTEIQPQIQRYLHLNLYLLRPLPLCNIPKFIQH